jgi:outer membrane protein
MKKTLILICLLTLSAAVMAESKVYTMDECIQMAQQKDPSLIQFRNAVRTANAAVWQQIGQFLPSLGLSYSQAEVHRGPLSPQFRYNPSTGSIENVADSTSIINKGYSAGFSSGLTLFDGFSNVWNYLGSKASKRGAEYSYSAALSDLEYVIKTDYYLVLKAKKDLDVATDAVNRSEELLKLFQEKYDLGSASLSEVLKQKVQYGTDQLSMLTAQNQVRTTMDNLALDIGIDPQTEFDIAGVEMRQEQIKDLDFYIKKASQEHPSLLEKQTEVEAYKYDVRSAWGNYLPTLSLSYRYGWNKEYFSDLKKFGPYDHSGTLSLSLGWTIFDGFTREYNMKRAKVGLNNARASEFYQRNKTIKDVQSAYRGIKLAEGTLQVTEEVERSASEDMDLVQEKYDLGAAALWELLDAQVSLKQAQFNKVKAEFDYNLALAQLQNAIGE